VLIGVASHVLYSTPLNDEKPGSAFISKLSAIASCIVLASMVSLIFKVSKLAILVPPMSSATT